MGFFLASMATFLVSFAYLAATVPTSDAPCLSEPETSNLVLRWLSIFETDEQGKSTGAELINSTLTPNFQLTDEGASNGDPAPLWSSREAVYDYVTHGASEPAVVDAKFSVLYTFPSCDVIGARWEYSARTAEGENAKVPVGTPVRYLGTEILQVDLSTRLVYNVTVSADITNYYKQIGLCPWGSA